MHGYALRVENSQKVAQNAQLPPDERGAALACCSWCRGRRERPYKCRQSGIVRGHGTCTAAPHCLQTSHAEAQTEQRWRTTLHGKGCGVKEWLERSQLRQRVAAVCRIFIMQEMKGLLDVLTKINVVKLVVKHCAWDVFIKCGHQGGEEGS